MHASSDPEQHAKLASENAFVVAVDKDEQIISLLFYDPIWGLRFTLKGTKKLIETLEACIITIETSKNDLKN